MYDDQLDFDACQTTLRYRRTVAASFHVNRLCNDALVAGIFDSTYVLEHLVDGILLELEDLPPELRPHEQYNDIARRLSKLQQRLAMDKQSYLFSDYAQRARKLGIDVQKGYTFP